MYASSRRVTASVRSIPASVGICTITFIPLSSVFGMYAVPMMPVGIKETKSRKSAVTVTKSFF